MEKKIDVNKIPCPALEVNKDRIVIDSNSFAVDIGVTVGTYCWDTFGQQASISEQDKVFWAEHNRVPEEGITCLFCKADEALAKQEHISIEQRIGDTLWEIHWDPTGPDTYVHYGIDITEE